MEILPLIGFGGPVVILLLFQLLSWRGIGRAWLRLIFIYIFAVATGVLTDVIWHVGQVPSAVIAGIVAPLFYCLVFSLLLRGKSSDAVRASTRREARRSAESQGWSPTVVAALIQAIATIIVAIIAHS